MLSMNGLRDTYHRLLLLCHVNLLDADWSTIPLITRTSTDPDVSVYKVGSHTLTLILFASLFTWLVVKFTSGLVIERNHFGFDICCLEVFLFDFITIFYIFVALQICALAYLSLCHWFLFVSAFVSVLVCFLCGCHTENRIRSVCELVTVSSVFNTTCTD